MSEVKDIYAVFPNKNGAPRTCPVHNNRGNALERCGGLGESISNLSGCTGWPDPLVLIPLYAREYSSSKKGASSELDLELAPDPLLNGTALESRKYFLYKEKLWSAGQEDSYEVCVASVDNLLRPKERRSPVRRQAITEEVRVFVWRRDEGKCSRCGSREKLEFDHIVPVSRGGSDTARNIELLCEACNRKKGAQIR